VRLNLTPLPAGDDVSVETWLENTHYQDWRKEQLRKSWALVNKGQTLNYRHYRCQSFIKREGYIEFKYPRTINARSDAFKCLTGPYFKRIEDELFKFPEFVKHLDINQRPEVIAGKFPVGQSIRATDYTSFEASFVPEIVYAVEIQLYSYMLKNLPNYHDLMCHIRRALCGRQCCRMGGRKNDGIRYSMNGTRMSGDMCTSLGNGFTNFMLMEFACRRVGSRVVGLYEGDDGLSQICGLKPSASMFSDLGFRLKLVDVNDAAEASFCGNVFVRGENNNICDPIKTILKFGWSMSDMRLGSDEDRRSLLRAKAMSLLATNPGAPVVQSLAQWVLRCLGKGPLLFSGQGGSSTYWEHRIAVQIAGGGVRPRNISVQARRLCERVFGVTLERQLSLEAWFAAQKVICPIPLHAIGDVPAQCREAWSDVVPVPSEYLREKPKFQQC